MSETGSTTDSKIIYFSGALIKNDDGITITDGMVNNVANPFLDLSDILTGEKNKFYFLADDDTHYDQIVLGTVNFWLPSTVNKLIRKYSGFSSKIEKSACRPLKGRVDLTNFEIENQTPGFSDKRFLSINKFVADVDVSSLIKGNEAIAEEIIIDINNIAVIKSAGNEYNFQVFANNIKNNTTSSDKKESKDRDKSDSSKSKKFLIKKLKLALGSVDYVDESSNSKKTYNINYEHEFTNVNDIDIIKKQLISDLKKYGLEFVIDYILSSMFNIGNVALDTLSKGKDIALQVTGDVKDAVVDVAGAATDAVGSAFGKVFGK